MMINMENNREGTAIITGAGRGIGLELCKWFSSHGIRTIGISRNVSALIGIPGVEAIEADLKDLNDVVVKLSPLIQDDSKGRHYLIHNAALLINAPFGTITEEEIREMTEVNYIVPLRLTQLLLPWLKMSLESHIIYVSSMGGYQGSVRYPGLSIYSSGKSAIGSLAECLAEEYRDSSMRFNALALGAVDTEMLQISLPGNRTGVAVTQVAAYIGRFAVEAYPLINGKVIPVAGHNP